MVESLRFRSGWFTAALLAVIATGGGRAGFAQQVSFKKDVAPLLVRRCAACHGEVKFKGEYQLHTFAALQKPGASGDASVVPGKPDASYLLKLLVEKDADSRMPKNADPLPAQEIELIRKWIAEGAKFDGAEPTATLVNIAEWKHREPLEKYPRPFPVTALAFSPDGAELAVGGHHEITLWNSQDGALLRRLKGVAERTYALAFSPDGKQLAVACGTPAQLGEVKLLSAADGAVIRHFGSMSDCAFAVAFSPDGQKLASCGADHVARVFDVASGKEEARIKDHSDWIMALAWSPDGQRLATASRDKTCKVFDAKSGALITTFAEHGDVVYSIAYTSDGKNAISAGGDGRVRYWIADDPGWENAEKMDKKKKHQVAEINGLTGPIHRLIAAPGLLFAATADRTVRQFELDKRTAGASYPGHNDWVYALAYHAGTKRLASAGQDGEVRVWEAGGKTPVATFIAAPGYQAAGK